MLLMLCVMAVLFVGPLGEAFILHHPESKPDTVPSLAATDAPATKMKRCQGEQLRDIRKMLLGALNLEREPRVSGFGMTSLREQWKAAFKATAHRSTKSEKVTGVSQASTPESPGVNQLTNSTDMHCCQLVSQIFIKDLGWEDWIVYPESFTYTQCTACTPQMDSTLCRAYSPHSKGDCCRPMSQALLPFLYLDEFNTMVISSVQLTQECGCRPGNEPHPQP